MELTVDWLSAADTVSKESDGSLNRVVIGRIASIGPHRGQRPVPVSDLLVPGAYSRPRPSWWCGLTLVVGLASWWIPWERLPRSDGALDGPVRPGRRRPRLRLRRPQRLQLRGHLRHHLRPRRADPGRGGPSLWTGAPRWRSPTSLPLFIATGDLSTTGLGLGRLRGPGLPAAGGGHRLGDEPAGRGDRGDRRRRGRASASCSTRRPSASPGWGSTAGSSRSTGPSARSSGYAPEESGGPWRCGPSPTLTTSPRRRR